MITQYDCISTIIRNGGKNGSGTYQQIINLIPPHDIFIEGFFGSGAITRRIKKARVNLGFDLDKKICSTFKNSDNTGFTVINLDTISLLQHGYPILNLFGKFGLKVFIYLDPPYLFETRRNQKKIYRYELSKEDHTRLLNYVTVLQIPVLISHYENELYNTMLPGWNKHTFESQTRQGLRTECLYFNYPKPEQLHDYSYLGDDYRERERITGIVKRNIKKYKRMAPIERNYLISELLKTFSDENK